MQARIINNGHRKVYPTCIGDLRIPKGQEYLLDDKKAIQELQEYPDITVEIIKPAGPTIDYTKYTINQVRDIARKAGIKGTFNMKKVTVIKLLEETT
jgi:hypothetical protein